MIMVKVATASASCMKAYFETHRSCVVLVSKKFCILIDDCMQITRVLCHKTLQNVRLLCVSTVMSLTI